jgi:flagellin-specific chaperone FliS
MEETVMDVGASVQAYQRSQTLSDNPDYLARELYRAVYRDLLNMQAALKEQKWDKLVNFGSHAQLIVSALHDSALTNSPEGVAFKTTHKGLWANLNTVIREHDADVLETTVGLIADFIHQLDARLHQPAVTEMKSFGWSG